MGFEVQTGYWKLDLASWELELCARSRGMLGLTTPESRPLSHAEWAECIHPADLGPVMEELWIAADQTQSSFSKPFRAVHPDGTLRQILGVANTILDSDGQPTSLVGSNIDLAEAIQLRESASDARSTVGLAAHPTAYPANENTHPATGLESPSISSTGGAFADAQRVKSHGNAVRAILQRRATSIIKARQARLGFFDDAMLGEPAFDMLLSLYAAQDCRQSSLDTLASIAGVPTAVAGRWLAYLDEQGLVRMPESAQSNEHIIPELTAEGRASFDAYFAFLVSNSG